MWIPVGKDRIKEKMHANFRYASHINGSELRHGSKPKSFCTLNLTLTLTFTITLTLTNFYTFDVIIIDNEGSRLYGRRTKFPDRNLENGYVSQINESLHYL